MQIWDMSPAAAMEEAVVVLWFETIKDARTFFVSDPRMKQPDFPAPAGTCEAWAVVRFFTPPNEVGKRAHVLMCVCMCSVWLC